jgi:hypothetical protein
MGIPLKIACLPVNGAEPVPGSIEIRPTIYEPGSFDKNVLTACGGPHFQFDTPADTFFK